MTLKAETVHDFTAAEIAELPYHEIPHVHKNKPPSPLDKLTCTHCKYDTREKWVKTELAKMKDTDKKVQVDRDTNAERDYVIWKVRVDRGEQGDVRGLIREYK